MRSIDGYVERLVDLIDPASHRLHNLSVEDARERILHGQPEAVLGIDGSFALVAREGQRVRMARSLDRPMRYFLATRREGPALIVADRIDAIHRQLQAEGLDRQFHPSYTRMVPAHHVIELQLVGCPDPDPTAVPGRGGRTRMGGEIGGIRLWVRRQRRDPDSHADGKWRTGSAA